jgi:hypothetical protein
LLPPAKLAARAQGLPRFATAAAAQSLERRFAAPAPLARRLHACTLALNSGAQSFTWNGRGNNGVTWPDGSYTVSISATGANGHRSAPRRRCKALSAPSMSAGRRRSSP